MGDSAAEDRTYNALIAYIAKNDARLDHLQTLMLETAEKNRGSIERVSLTQATQGSWINIGKTIVLAGLGTAITYAVTVILKIGNKG